MNDDIIDLSSDEMRVLSEVIDLWEKIISNLNNVDLRPLDPHLHVETNYGVGYIGRIGYNQSETITFQLTNRTDDTPESKW